MPGRKHTQRQRKRVTKSRGAPIYTNTIRSTITAKDNQATFTLQQLLANTLSGVQSQLDRNIKLISIGVQFLPSSRDANSAEDAQLLLAGNWSGTSGISIALRPPRMLSKVNPTFLKYVPTLYQKQPCSASDTTNQLVISLDHIETPGSDQHVCDVIITTKVHLLPQTVIVEVVPT